MVTRRSEPESDLEHQSDRRAYWRARAERAEAALREIAEGSSVQARYYPQDIARIALEEISEA